MGIAVCSTEQNAGAERKGMGTMVPRLRAVVGQPHEPGVCRAGMSRDRRTMKPETPISVPPPSIQNRDTIPARRSMLLGTA